MFASHLPSRCRVQSLCRRMFSHLRLPETTRRPPGICRPTIAAGTRCSADFVVRRRLLSTRFFSACGENTHTGVWSSELSRFLFLNSGARKRPTSATDPTELAVQKQGDQDSFSTAGNAQCHPSEYARIDAAATSNSLNVAVLRCRSESRAPGRDSFSGELQRRRG